MYCLVELFKVLMVFSLCILQYIMRFNSVDAIQNTRGHCFNRVLRVQIRTVLNLIFQLLMHGIPYQIFVLTVLLYMQLVLEAFNLFQSDPNRINTTAEKVDSMNAFFNTAPNVQRGSTTYISRAIINQLLDGTVHVSNGMECIVT